MKKFFLGGLLAIVAFASVPAQAAEYAGVYTSTTGSPLMANLSFTTSDTLNAVGGYDVLSLGGDVDGDAITALIANPDQPNGSLSPDGLFIFDNVYQVTGWGLLFSTASGTEFNFYANGDVSSPFTLYSALNGSYGANSNGTFEVAEVPEPAEWAMMLAGFGLMGATLRTSNRGRDRNLALRHA